jgi:predicted nuclease of predicted toxin-antitoxin system
MKFLGNMGISPRTILYLESLGHEAKRLLDENLERLPDEKILEKARAEHSIILTSDLDFGDLLALTRAELPSVIIFRLGDMRAENVNRFLMRVLAEHAELPEQGAMVSVTEQRIRVRRLPI